MKIKRSVPCPARGSVKPSKPRGIRMRDIISSGITMIATSGTANRNRRSSTSTNKTVPATRVVSVSKVISYKNTVAVSPNAKSDTELK